MVKDVKRAGQNVDDTVANTKSKIAEVEWFLLRRRNAILAQTEMVINPILSHVCSGKAEGITSNE